MDRLFPSLITVLILVTIFGYLTLFSNEIRYLGKHLISGSLFIENIVYFTENSYFENSNSKILLNLWSLSLEVQFYILCPIILKILNRNKFNQIILISISFLANIIISNFDSIHSYFLITARLWEFLVGATLAIYDYKLKVIFIEDRIKIIITALIIISFCCFEINSAHNYYGFIAILPVCATIMLIVSASSGKSMIIFNNTILEYLGKISYPLYLCHWPFLIFYLNLDLAFYVLQ